METIDNMETMEDSKMETEKDYKCTNKYCYVFNVIQAIPEELETICHNCGFDLKAMGKVS